MNKVLIVQKPGKSGDFTAITTIAGTGTTAAGIWNLLKVLALT